MVPRVKEEVLANNYMESFIGVLKDFRLTEFFLKGRGHVTDRNGGVDKVWFGGQAKKISFRHSARNVTVNF